MLGSHTRVGSVVRRMNVIAHQVNALRKAGLSDFPRVDRGLRKLAAVRRYGAIAGPLHANATSKGEAVGLVDERGALTYAELDRRSNALGRAWQRAGLGAGSAVGVLCRDHRGLVDCLMAGTKIGARVVLMNTGSSGPQLVEVVKREQIGVLVYDEEFAEMFAGLDDGTPRYLAWTEESGGHDLPLLENLIEDSDGADLPAPRQPGAVVLLTSGTTGTPKGAPRQVSSPLAAAFFLERIPLRTGEATFIGSPMFHATGFANLALAFSLGSAVVVRRRFDPEATLKMVQDNGCSAAVLVPTMLARIIDLGDDVLGSYDTSALRIVLLSGSALSPELGNRAQAAFGPCIYNLYGSTEVAVATVCTPQDWQRAPGTVGREPHGVTLKLLDDHDRPVTEPNVKGRIFLANDLQFSGYTDGQNKAVVDGLLSSGDVGHRDESGLLFIDGRDDDMIVSGGENVYPAEIEDLLIGYDSVTDVAVIGVDDPDFGQRLRAYVVMAEGHHLDADTVRDYVRQNLARYKVPRDVVFVDEVPRNPTGKVLRRELRERG